MCEESSSNIGGNPTESDFGDAATEVEANMECGEDVNLNGDDQYRIDGMEDIGMVRFDLLSAEEISKYHFPDNVVGYDFYNTYGLVSGFSIRKSKIGKNVDGDVVRHNFVCSSEGYRELGMIENRRREPKSVTRYGCQASMRIKLNKESGRWVVTYFNDEHSHPLMGHKFTGMLRSHRRIGEEDAAQLRGLRSVGINTPQIYCSFAEQAGGFDKIGFRKRDMYNLIQRERMRSDGQKNKALCYLEDLTSTDPGMYWSYTTGNDNHLEKIFWCDGCSRFDYEIFGDVLAFDATYGRNKYNCPLVVFSGVNHHNHTIVFGGAIVSDETESTYVWLLEQFMTAMKGKAPKAVITDGDLAMRNAIRRVYPNAHHRLCAWHLLRNATTNVANKKFTTMFRNAMLGDYDVGEFRRRWNGMVTECGVEGHRWVNDLYMRKDMWAAAFMRGKFFGGFRTTSRCEGLHAQLGRYVKNSHDLAELVQHFQRALNILRNSEVEADFKSAYGDPVMQSTMEELEKDAAKVYTREMFFMCRIYMKKAGKMKVVGCKETPSYMIYTVAYYRNARKAWRVSFDADSIQIKCSCQRFETHGLPCAHIFAVLFFLDIGELPKCVIMPRWTKMAKQGHELAAAEQGNWMSDNLIYNRLGGLMSCCRRLCNIASRNADDYKSVREKVCNEIILLEAKHEVDNGAGCSSQANCSVVMDPTPLK